VNTLAPHPRYEQTPKLPYRWGAWLQACTAFDALRCTIHSAPENGACDNPAGGL